MAMVFTLRDSLKLETASDMLLVGAAVIAMIVANSPLAGLYGALIVLPVKVRVGNFQIAKPLLLWINDGKWPHVYGTALLCGVGFTMSLFIGSLAFEETGVNLLFDERLGIIFGSLLSGACGYMVLRATLARQPTS